MGRRHYLDQNLAANAIHDVPKSTVKRWREWEDNGRTMRGEVSTFVADAAISPSMTPTRQIDLSDQWLSDLNRALHALAEHPVPAHGVDADHVNDGVRAFFGIDLDIASVPWTTAHCDLHWGNLTGPTLTILDWEPGAEHPPATTPPPSSARAWCIQSSPGGSAERFQSSSTHGPATSPRLLPPRDCSDLPTAAN